MTRNTLTATLMERGVRKVFFDEYDRFQQVYPQLYTVVSSEKRQETDVVTYGLGTYHLKSEGVAPQFDTGGVAWTKVYTHQTYALGCSVTLEAREDDLYGMVENIGRRLGKNAAYTQEVNAASVFNNLSDTVYTAAGTNYTLLSTAHYLSTGATWSNRPTVATDLSIESLETALAAWRTGMVDQRGLKINAPPEILLVGPSDELLADRLLNSVDRPGSADNDLNAVKRRRNLRVVVWDQMTDDGRWFLLAPKTDRALHWFNRKSVEVRRSDDPLTWNLSMIGRYRESHGLSHPTGIYGSP